MTGNGRGPVAPPAVAAPTGMPHTFLMWLPIAMIAALCATYLIAPEWYARYVLHRDSREYQAVEILTVSFALIAAITGGIATCKLWRRRRALGGVAGPLLVGLVALAAFFFAGEEVSWGQTWFRWKTPEEYTAFSHETNLHNGQLDFIVPVPFVEGGIRVDPSVQGLGSTFIVCVFFVLPLLWSRENHSRLPRSLSCAVAHRPAIIACATGFIWKWMKNGYMAIDPDHEQREWYLVFGDQINEHKEMLIAMTLCYFAIYRLRWIHLFDRASHDTADRTADRSSSDEGSKISP